MRFVVRRGPPPDPWLRWSMLGLGILALGAARFFPFHVVPPLCAFKLLTGHPCPACGMTRSWVHMAHGRVGEALAQNPGGSTLFVVALLATAWLAGRSLGWLPAVSVEAGPGEAIALRLVFVGVLVLNWAYVWISGVA